MHNLERLTPELRSSLNDRAKESIRFLINYYKTLEGEIFDLGEDKDKLMKILFDSNEENKRLKGVINKQDGEIVSLSDTVDRVRKVVNFS